MCFTMLYSGDENYLYINKTKICKFKGLDNIAPYQFSLGSLSKDCKNNKMNKISLKANGSSFVYGVIGITYATYVQDSLIKDIL